VSLLYRTAPEKGKTIFGSATPNLCKCLRGGECSFEPIKMFLCQTSAHAFPNSTVQPPQVSQQCIQRTLTMGWVTSLLFRLEQN
jgi:hypothetical protein